MRLAKNDGTCRQCGYPIFRGDAVYGNGVCSRSCLGAWMKTILMRSKVLDTGEVQTDLYIGDDRYPPLVGGLRMEPNAWRLFTAIMCIGSVDTDDVDVITEGHETVEARLKTQE